MEKSKVYFSDFRALPGTSVLKKLEKLIRAAGIGKIDLDGKIVAIKIHFGEPGNLAFLRPNYAKVVADVVKSLGGKPFLTDCNTLYAGRRKNALEHLEAAYENGYSPFSTGCHVIIGDGVKGTDDVDVPVVGGEYVEKAHIGRAIMDADIFISLSHFKGHEATGFGGALKNIGMGCGSRAGKMAQHNSGKPEVDSPSCVKCHICAKNCGQDAIFFDGPNGTARIDQDICVGCGRCIGACNYDAIYNQNSSANDLLGRKMAEYSKAVVDGRPHFHVSMVQDISPYCDCHSESDVPILPDVGMFASFDPLALDQACVDACLRQEPIPGSLLYDRMHEPGFHDHHDHFLNTTPGSVWETCLDQAEKIGLGTRAYELVTIK